MAILSEAELEKLYEDEALDEARDVVGGLELRLQQVMSGDLSKEEAKEILKQDASNLSLKVKAVNLTGLSAICRRLEDYCWHMDSIEDKNIVDLQQFSDRITRVLDGAEETIANVAKEIRTLPHHATFELDEVTFSPKEVIIVLPKKVAARVVERELNECGYRVSIVLDSLEAFEIILDTRPDLVITSAVLPRLSGVDLICALKAMPTTRDVSVALLTSLPLNHPDLRALPMNVGIIRRGDNFGSDLAEVLQRFDIT